MPTPLRLPRPLHRRLDEGVSRLMLPGGASARDFLEPAGEPALTAPDSVSWMVFKNPLALFVGGVAAVVLELAEPRVCTGVWAHTAFRERPLERLKRTGHAAMMTVYGPRSRTLAMIARVSRMHTRVQGLAADGRRFSATDPELLCWVHATASFGFLAAYDAYVRRVSPVQRDRFYAEGQPAAAHYGAPRVPGSQRELDALFAAMLPRLEPSPVITEFLQTMGRLPMLPRPLRPFQGVLIDAAVALLPGPVRQRLELGAAWSPRLWQHALVRRAGAAIDRLVLDTHPAVLACRRLGLSDDHLVLR